MKKHTKHMISGSNSLRGRGMVVHKDSVTWGPADSRGLAKKECPLLPMESDHSYKFLGLGRDTD